MKTNSNLPTFPNDQRGYLLIEALIALSIFAIGFLAVGKMVIFTIHNNSRSNIMTQATLLATQKIEELKGQSLDRMNSGHDRKSIFSRSWTVTDTIGYNTSRQIHVTVSWTRRGHTRTLELKTNNA